MGGWREGRGLHQNHHHNYSDHLDNYSDDDLDYHDHHDVIEGGEEGGQPSTRGRLPKEGGGQVLCLSDHHHGLCARMMMMMMMMIKRMMMKVVSHHPHLKTIRVWEAGEKVESCKKKDNLKVEGGFHFA